MTKFKAKVLVETDGETVGETDAVFVFGIPPEEDAKLTPEERQLIAHAILVEFVGALQKGIRVYGTERGIKIWPQEG